MARAKIKGAQFTVLLGGLIGTVGAAMYLVAIRPAMNPDPYKRIRDEAHAKMPPSSPFN